MQSCYLPSGLLLGCLGTRSGSPFPAPRRFALAWFRSRHFPSQPAVVGPNILEARASEHFSVALFWLLALWLQTGSAILNFSIHRGFGLFSFFCKLGQGLTRRRGFSATPNPSFQPTAQSCALGALRSFAAPAAAELKR